MTTTPIHHWTMDNLSGSNVVDEIAGGTALAAVNWSKITGKFSYGLGQSNTSYQIYLPADTAFKAISLWIMRADTTKYSVFGCTSAGNKLFVIQTAATGNRLYFYNGSGAVNSDLTITDNNWHQVWIIEGSDNNHHWFWLDGVKDTAERLSNLAGVLKFHSRPNFASGQENCGLDNIQWYDRIPSDDEIAYLAAATSQSSTLPIPVVGLLAVLDQRYDLEALIIRVLMDHRYSLLERKVGINDQFYGLRLLTTIIQYYGDTPAVRRLLAQYYGSATMLRRLLAEPYGDALALRQTLDQEWTLPEALRRIMEQRYSISGDELRSLMAENYAISEYELLRMQIDQVYVMGAAGALSQRPEISATADGVAIDPHHISIEVDEGEYAIRGEIHLARQDEYLRCHHLWTEIVITIDGDEYRLLVDSPRRSRPELGRAEYIVPCVSPTVLLDAPYADTITREFAGAMASAIVADLAASAGISVAWQCVDWYLPPATLYANAETPLSVIRKIVAAVGGIIQTTPAGILLCRPEYPVTVPGWATATPDHYLTDMDNYFSVDSSPVIRDGFNRFLISNQDAATAGLTIEQVDIDATTKEIRVYQVPWNDTSIISLRTSGGAWVSIIDDGVIPETITDQVEIVGGEGQTTKPIYAMTSHAYKQEILGAITTAEDGHLTTEIKYNSLLDVVYSTRYRRFIVSDSRIEDVQFYPEEVTP
ncbi:MAG: hypothetical protein ACOYB1_18670 [Limnohabitans sp.]